MNWPKSLRGKVKLREPLKKHTTFKIGGPAEFFIEPKDISDLKLLLNSLKRDKIRFRVLGAGSNVLAGDSGVKGAVLTLDSPYFKKTELKGKDLKVGAGLSLNRLVWLAYRCGLSGAEFLSGIPGTVGGALAMNAGISEKGKKAKVKSIGDLVKSVTVIDSSGTVKTLDRPEIKFGYRQSSLSKYIILSAHLELGEKSKKRIGQKIKYYLKYRRATHDLSRPSAGCIFKNPQRESAGRLIDLCGLKGRRVRGAGVSLKHANFILNLGDARAIDVLDLIKLIKKEVRDRFNITLEQEVRVWQ